MHAILQMAFLWIGVTRTKYYDYRWQAIINYDRSWYCCRAPAFRFEFLVVFDVCADK